MTTTIQLHRKADQIQINIELNFQPGTSMMDYEEQILQALNEAGRQATGHCLEQFDADGSPIVIGGVKLTSKGPVLKSYQTPFGETAVERHVYQSSEGGPTFCPLDQQARIVNSSTPRFAKMCAFKYATMNSTLAQRDLLESHGRKVSRCYPGHRPRRCEHCRSQRGALALCRAGVPGYGDHRGGGAGWYVPALLRGGMASGDGGNNFALRRNGRAAAHGVFGSCSGIWQGEVL